ncbi:hypothetical protein K6V92_18245 [Cupriavidus respiraculi]|uniref:hypothetical protein n=1 Tax=Cupriavidus respiraculi TaxID=195930 RepID=UPI001C98B7F8|nr:hypothetical protein [Cupriavidus respiraculi]MBY4948558.1 hypothetical protein [Cupriavidus respiraculi]
MASSVFAVIEAIGTAHLISKQWKKKSEIDRALVEHADGHARFTADSPSVSSLLAKRGALLTLLDAWPRDEDETPVRVWQRSGEAIPLNWESINRHLNAVEAKLESDALDLVDDFEHYVVYEQAANQLADSSDNVRALGIAVARDCVVQLGGTGCNAADAATKFGAHGVDLVANGIASGAFGIAMGALHVGAGMLGWYQAERRLQDLEAVRQRGANLRTPQGREAHVRSAIEGHQQWLIAEAARTELDGVRHLHMANAAAVGSARTQDDVVAAKELVEVLTMHQAQALKNIEATELKKSSRAKSRIAYGTVSMLMGAGAIIAATVASGGIFALVLSAVGFGLGVYWLGSAFLRFFMDRIEANLVARRDGQQKVEAERILKEHRRPTIHEMRRNRFVAIDAMLLALFDGDRPISGRALADALTSLGMDRNLVEALKLRSTVRLDTIYAADRDEILEKLRCFASKRQKEALKAAIGGMTLRSDEALLKSLRQLFQEFIEGKTAMRQEYERRTGVFSYLGQKVRGWLPGKAGPVNIASAQPSGAQAEPAMAQLSGCAPV